MDLGNIVFGPARGQDSLWFCTPMLGKYGAHCSCLKEEVRSLPSKFAAASKICVAAGFHGVQVRTIYRDGFIQHE